VSDHSTLFAAERADGGRAMQGDHDHADSPLGPEIVAESPVMRDVLRLVARVAPSELPVLIQGESGTGKELIARALHQASARARGPLLALNCAAIPDTLVESTLFGHERGAFTGAVDRRPGKFELAHGGTLFLDEIAELPLPSQAKLLRALQECEIERVGGTQPIATDVRLIAATNRDLAVLARTGAFRQDLYYRIHGVTITLPPLRERAEDLLPLADVFLRRHAGHLGRPVPRFTSRAIAALRAHRWPGNVRELEHAVQRAVVLAAGTEIRASDVGLLVGDARHVRKRIKAETERDHILDALREHHGRRLPAAMALGISRTTLWRRLNRRYRDSSGSRRRPDPGN
jgi:two-component system response regulator FlrC